MTNTTTAARALAANLSARAIAIKHVQALDLLAAGAGLANRHVLAQQPSLPSIKRVNIALLSSTATVLARHDLQRRQIIIDETSAVLAPAAAFKELLEVENIRISIAEIESPDLFLQTDRGEGFVKDLCNDLYYSRYSRYSNDGPMSLKQGNELAAMILEAKAAPLTEDGPSDPVEAAIARFFRFGEETDDFWYGSGRSEVETIVQKLADAIEELEIDVALDVDDWVSALEDPVCQLLADEDDSEASDLLGSYDKCEVNFFLIPQGYVLDQMVRSHKPWPDFAHLGVGPELQHALSSLGYTVAEYRRMSGNGRENDEPLLHGLKKRSEPLVTPTELKELVENACSDYFAFSLYAVISIQDLIKLDLTKPITFSQAAISVSHPYSGTFYDTIKKHPITVLPREGGLFANVGYSPADSCGLYTPAYAASLSNPQPAARALELA
ncbi:hypothetical protein [Sphingosinicella sp. BN140058]|uniref:hypothetical protein n=1 Tax=Sphingosinicella sp. BN140058 TaxID=1892855 RepID=UPI001011E0E2|nr:hypothetical protein [Sphingosinicella sp. BN140058]QAY80326.1 hypothetical protein ETR14_27165 [Sphingosinicella sp. BN140058]